MTTELTELDELLEQIAPQGPTQRARLNAQARAALELEILREAAQRAHDGIRLYRPLPAGRPFHGSRKPFRLLTGSNRSGKTLTGAAEAARAASGLGLGLPTKGGLMVIVGKDEKHLGDPLYKTLCLPGQFKIVPDEITGHWRAVRPDPLDQRHIDPIDLEREHLWRPAPALLPPRLIRDIQWAKLGKGIPDSINLKNGWKIRFFTGNAKPPQGIATNYIWFDEEIESELWYSEMAARMLDRQREGSRFVWTACPQAATAQLDELHEMAERNAPHIAEFQLFVDDNPYLSEEAKQLFWASLTTEEERQIRYFGQYARHGLRVYPEYDPMRYHGVEAFPIPDNWSRWMVIDPGVQQAAVLFAAIPPTDDTWHIYDELLIKNCNAEKLAEKVAEKVGRYTFEEFLIDDHMGKVRQATGKTIKQHYSEALQRRGVTSRNTGHGFAIACDDRLGREEALHRALRVGLDGVAKVQVHLPKCAALDRQIKQQHYSKTVNNERVRRDNDLVDCLEYLAARNPHYREPVRYEPPVGHEVYEHFKKKRLREWQRSASGGWGPGTITL